MKILVHLGVHKTATTFIQSQLANNRAELSGKGYGVAGIAWDGAVTNRPGARMAPRAIREASHMLCDGIHPFFNTTPADLLTDLRDGGYFD